MLCVCVCFYMCICPRGQKRASEPLQVVVSCLAGALSPSLGYTSLVSHFLNLQLLSTSGGSVGCGAKTESCRTKQESEISPEITISQF